MYTSRPNLNDYHFKQHLGDTLSLSGTTNFIGELRSKGVLIDASTTGVTGSSTYVLTLVNNKIVLNPIHTDNSNSVSTVVFNNYTGITSTSINSKFSTLGFNTYSGNTKTLIDNRVSNTCFASYSGNTLNQLNNLQQQINASTAISYAGLVMGG